MSTPLEVAWKPLPQELAGQQRKLDQVLRSWEGTPYLPGRQDLGKGVDCVRYVAAVLDAMRGKQTPIETLPDDTALHNRKAAIAGMHKLRRALEPNDMLRFDGPAELEPGDVIVTGPVGGGPGHAMIVGCKPNVIWESSGTGVRRVGLYGLRQAAVAVYYVFRCGDRGSWAVA